MTKPSLLLVFLLSISLSCFSQEEEKESFGYYLATGLSVTNTGEGTFAETAFPFLEVGMSKKNLSYGISFFRSNFSDFESDEISNYSFELKTAASFPIGDISGYGLAGVGNYFSTDRFFIEYGLGAIYPLEDLDIFIQVSNWDGFWYVSPGLSIMLN